MFSTSQQEFIENPEHMFINRGGGLVHPQQHPQQHQQQQHHQQHQQQQQQQQQQVPFHMHPHHPHHPQNNFSPMAINPSSTQSTGMITDPSNPSWFGTSIDSNASSFGQSPPVYGGGRDLLVTPSNSTGHLMEGYGGGPEDDEMSQRNHQEIFEKRRRRRESHNAVERRRRDNINERIQELSTLLPDHLLDSVPASSNVMSVTTGQSGANGKPINKGTILKLSVDHIKELKEEVNHCKERIQELERLIGQAKGGSGVDFKTDPLSPTSMIKTEDHLFHPQQQQQQQQQQNISLSGNRNNNNNGGARHERVGSIQFQQQFGKLHINSDGSQPQA